LNIPIFTLADVLWMGNEASCAEVRMRLQLLSQGILPSQMGTALMPMPDDNEEDDDPIQTDGPLTKYVDIQGKLGVITTQGSLTNQNSFMSWLLGGTTYSQIRDAFLEAATLKQEGHLTAILHIVESPGGVSTGLEDTGALIRQVASHVCPVLSYGNTLCSAAYWLAAAGSKVYAPRSADVGSIGTRMSIPNYFKAMEKEGIAMKNVSAGKYKTMGDPTQPWSKETESYLQERVDSMNEIFLETVAEYRDKPLEHVREKMAQGREFTGIQAQALGLVDAVTNLDTLVQQTQAKLAKPKSH
jgi:signal peptide peptidase SppA